MKVHNQFETPNRPCLVLGPSARIVSKHFQQFVNLLGNYHLFTQNFHKKCLATSRGNNQDTDSSDSLGKKSNSKNFTEGQLQ